MTALSSAKTYLATLKDDGRTRYAGHPDVLLGELVAEIDAAPVAGVYEMHDGRIVADATGLLNGQTVRLLALDSGGAGEVGS